MEFPTITPLKRDLLEKATQTYYEALKQSPETVEYLKGRGITGEVAQYFRLGFVSEPLENHDAMQGMLSIPYIAPSGTVAIRFRRLQGDGHKYHQESGSYTPLFNVRDLHRPEPYLVLCEGELDAVVMSGLCGIPAVALPGTGQWKSRGRYYRRLLLDYDRVFVCLDPDKAGQDVAADVVRKVPNAINVILPADVNDTYLEHGRQFILEELGLWESSETQSSVSTAAA